MNQLFAKKYLPFWGAVLIALAALVILFPLFMADVYFQRALASAREASKNEDPDQGEAAFQKVEDLFAAALFWDDDNPEIYRGQGDLYVRASHTELESFLKAHRVKKVIRSQPPVKLKEKQGEEIRDPAVKVKDLTPAEVRAKIKKGEQRVPRFTEETVYITPPYPGSANGYEKKAVQAYNAGIALNPLDARLFLGLAAMMQFKAPFEKTEAVFRRAVQLDPNNANVQFSFGMV